MTAPVAQASPQFVVVDTSVWASSLLPNDVNHDAARGWIGQHISAGGELVAPALIVVETSASLARITGSQTTARNAVTHLYSFSAMRLVPMDQALIDEAADVAATFSLKGADAIFVAVAKTLSIPLVSFDHEQLSRPTAIITTIKP